MGVSVLLEKYGPWALITGASSGIGEEFSRQLAAKRFNLVLVARREMRLKRLADELARNHLVQIRVVPADLAAVDFLDYIAEATKDIDIGLVVNNAGFALTGDFLDHALEDEVALLNVNCRTPMILAHYFGKRMAHKGRGGIINISSAAAFIPLPYWTNYSASKIYLLHFSEALWFELRKSGVDVLAVCPGSTRTEFAKVAGTQMQGGEAAPIVAAALENLGKKVSLVPGIGNVLTTILSRILTRRQSVLLGSMVIGKQNK